MWLRCTKEAKPEWCPVGPIPHPSSAMTKCFCSPVQLACKKAVDSVTLFVLVRRCLHVLDLVTAL